MPYSYQCHHFSLLLTLNEENTIRVGTFLCTKKDQFSSMLFSASPLPHIINCSNPCHFQSQECHNLGLFVNYVHATEIWSTMTGQRKCPISLAPVSANLIWQYPWPSMVNVCCDWPWSWKMNLYILFPYRIQSITAILYTDNFPYSPRWKRYFTMRSVSKETFVIISICAQWV